MSLAQLGTDQPAISLLQRSLARGRLGHGYLFHGGHLPQLESLARNLAKAINCEEIPAAGGLPLDSCDHCSSCRRIDLDQHPDIAWIRPESKSRVIAISQIREFLQAVYLKANEARYKVGIFVAVDRLTTESANAFLKTLEEPPQGCILLLLTTEPTQLLPTILSRCLKVGFGSSEPLLREDQQQWISEFAEQVALTEGATVLQRYRALGSLVSKLTALKAELNDEISAKSPLERYSDIDPDLKERWELELVAAVEAEYRLRRNEHLQILQRWLRDVWVAAQSHNSTSWELPQLSEYSRKVGSRLSIAEAESNLSTIERTQKILNTTVQEALTLEVALLNLHLG